MNKLILMGRLTKDPEIRYTQDSKPIAKFTLAVDRRFKKENQPEADFFQMTAFGKIAEFTEKHLKKGVKVITESVVQNNKYTDESGTTHYGFTIIVENIEFCESKKDTEHNNSEPQKDADGFMNVPEGLDEDLPFAR